MENCIRKNEGEQTCDVVGRTVRHSGTLSMYRIKAEIKSYFRTQKEFFRFRLTANVSAPQFPTQKLLDIESRKVELSVFHEQKTYLKTKKKSLKIHVVQSRFKNY